MSTIYTQSVFKLQGPPSPVTVSIGTYAIIHTYVRSSSNSLTTERCTTV